MNNLPLLRASALLIAALACLSLAPGVVAPQAGAVTGLYRNETFGLSIILPDGWTGEEQEDSRPLLQVRGAIPGGEAVADVWALPRDGEASAQTWLGVQTADYGETLASNSYVVEGADSAYQALIAREDAAGREFTELWTSAVRGSQVFLVRTTTLANLWTGAADTAGAFAASLRLFEPMPFGAARSDSLFQYWGEIVTIDPALTQSSPADIVGAVFSGLVRLGADLEIVPDLAATWERSPDGLTYTFAIDANARFHDGRAVTAADFKYSWERALRPDTGSPTAMTYLGDIVGAREMSAGAADSVSGVEAVDSRTLRVTIDAPRSYFLYKLAYPTAYVVDHANVERGGEAWTDAPNGTGPFKLKRWLKDELLVLERNDAWHGGTPALAHAVYRIFAGYPMQMYERGEIDLTGVGRFDIDRARDPANALNTHLREGAALCTFYLGFNVTIPPFDDPKVRQALALAAEVDKEIAVSRLGLDERAAGILPPGMPGHNAALEPFAFDPAAARRLLAESRYGGAENMPVITSYASGGAMHWAWEHHLGLEVEAVSIFEFGDRLDRLERKELGVFRGGWCADYPDPQNFLDILFRTGSAQNHFAYANPEVDALLDAAAVHPGQARRHDLYRQAERLILDDWVAVPLWHSRDFVLVRPYVKGYELTPIGVAQLHNVSIEREAGE
ncbi:MAG: peptide ABC transporter substrate-binding protein [Chloroflexota bacterium]|nr:peptide ABC transporter substrate-binding protein [Chloroflexota bacterium]